jgi:hypothetical protein
MIFWKRIYLADTVEIPLHNFGFIIKRGKGFIDVWKRIGGK